MLADPAAVVHEIGENPFAPHLVDRLDQLRKKEFDATPFSLQSTRRSPRRPLDAVTTDLLADFPQVLGKISYCSHG
jgi:hypothetical protein